MNKLNASIAAIEMPARLRRRPVSDTGFPVPWFVATVDGKPDFRVADPKKMARAIRFDLCWLCGQTLGRFKCFVIGPMGAVNRISAEPPSHRDCAEYAVRACPFLTRPKMRRNDQDLPVNHAEPGGFMIPRNPGCTLLWIAHTYRVFRAGANALIEIGDPVELVPYAEGRPATRDELDASFASGLPILAKEAKRDGDAAMIELALCVERAHALFKAKLKLETAR